MNCWMTSSYAGVIGDEPHTAALLVEAHMSPRWEMTRQGPAHQAGALARPRTVEVAGGGDVVAALGKRSGRCSPMKITSGTGRRCRWPLPSRSGAPWVLVVADGGGVDVAVHVDLGAVRPTSA